MTDTAHRPETLADGTVADAVRGNWVDTYAPPWTRPYLRLSRADRPVGTWLLFIPCIWGVLLSALSHGGLGWHGVWIIIGCGLGSWLMRGAGCTWNDITDRDIDAKVARTRSRPLPSGQLTTRAAAIWMALQALIAFAILLCFNPTAIALGIAALVPVCVYPFAKRFTWWPQVFLGLAFNWGALVGWTAHSGSLDWPAVALYLAGITWTIFYDTIYAHQDKEDDALIGVKSTALLFGENTPIWLTGFRIATVVILALATFGAVSSGSSIATIICAVFALVAYYIHLTWQQRRLNIDDPDLCLRLFRSNRDAGLIFAGFLWVGLLW